MKIKNFPKWARDRKIIVVDTANDQMVFVGAFNNMDKAIIAAKFFVKNCHVSGKIFTIDAVIDNQMI